MTSPDLQGLPTKGHGMCLVHQWIANTITTELMTDWPAIKLMYQQGLSCYAISNRFDGKPTRQGIRKRAKREGWETEVTGVVTERHRATDIVPRYALNHSLPTQVRC